MVAVSSARTATPRTAPVSASSPEGRSTATRNAGVAFIASIAAAGAPVTSERSPVPNTASTSTSAPASSDRQ
jgi:hypothetical protein